MSFLITGSGGHSILLPSASHSDPREVMQHKCSDEFGFSWLHSVVSLLVLRHDLGHISPLLWSAVPFFQFRTWLPP